MGSIISPSPSLSISVPTAPSKCPILDPRLPPEILQKFLFPVCAASAVEGAAILTVCKAFKNAGTPCLYETICLPSVKSFEAFQRLWEEKLAWDQEKSRKWTRNTKKPTRGMDLRACFSSVQRFIVIIAALPPSLPAITIRRSKYQPPQLHLSTKEFPNLHSITLPSGRGRQLSPSQVSSFVAFLSDFHPSYRSFVHSDHWPEIFSQFPISTQLQLIDNVQTLKCHWSFVSTSTPHSLSSHLRDNTRLTKLKIVLPSSDTWRMWFEKANGEPLPSGTIPQQWISLVQGIPPSVTHIHFSWVLSLHQIDQLTEMFEGSVVKGVEKKILIGDGGWKKQIIEVGWVKKGIKVTYDRGTGVDFVLIQRT